MGDGFGLDGPSDVGEVDSLAIDPTMATLTITDPAVTKMQTFKATGVPKGGGAPIAVPAVFSVDDATKATIDPASGVLTTTNKAGGTVMVTASYGGKSASATVTIVMDLHVAAPGGDGGTAVPPELFDPTKVTVGTDPTKTPAIIYPSDKTAFPPNIYKILFQWKKAGMNAFEVKFEAPGLSVAVYTKGDQATCVKAGTNGGCWEADEKTWAWLASTAAGKDVTVTVSAADSTKPGTIYKSKPITVRYAKKPVPGAIYYWSTTVAGVRRATVSDAAPTNYLTPSETGQCVACHTLSRNGKRLGADVGGENLWVVSVGATFPPPPVFKADPAMKKIPNSWVTFNPDATRVVSAAQGILTLRDGDTGAALGKGMNGTIPLGTGTFGTMPDWSPDGKHLVFARSTKASGRKVTGGSIALLDFMGGDTFGTPKDLITSTAGADDNYFPMFAPTSDWIAYGHGTASEKAGNSQLRLVNVAGGPFVELTTANTVVNDGVVPTGVSNNQPTWAPKTDDDFLWIAFQSKRDYGFVLGPGASYGAGKNQLWIAAIDTSKLGSGDPSRPAFRIPFQELTEQTHRPFWAEDAVKPPPPMDGGVPDAGSDAATDAGPPCLAVGEDCTGGGTCCAPLICDVVGEFKYACQ
jgi:hypothetical protein